MYYAHCKENCGQEDWQLLREHLENVSRMSGAFARVFNHENFGKLIGLFHDFGKYSCEFQQRLNGGKKVDHATAGALELISRFGIYGEKILAYCVIGHHSGLPNTGSIADGSSFKGRMREEPHNYSAYKHEQFEKIEPEFKMLINNPEKVPFSVSFITRMLFSCLVDADWIDTETFMRGQKERGNFSSLSNLLDRLNDHAKKFIQDSDINKKRQEILNECITKATGDKGFYRLTVPTGGGKTLSSMAFALNHAIKNGQDRIIYTIPYTSIIEQNAQVFRDIFGDRDILEHHSNYSFTEDDNDETSKKLKLASENWDVPIVVTTNVQFFESLFANKPSKCRKLHNIANSVIILDEAQMLPVGYLKPCLRALEELVQHYKCTIVLCTATQPALDGFMEIKPIEIISNPSELEKFFKRVEVKNIGRRSDDELVEAMSQQKQILTIVNTKKHAKAVYNKLKNEDGTYHFSTLMCPIHRKKILAEIKGRLKNPELVTRLVSTQLIEAGVDIDFPYVYRSSAGLDSVIQSAGRCNRNGKLERGIVNIFHTTQSYGKSIGYLQRSAEIGRLVIEDFDDPICEKAIQQYFTALYANEDRDKKKILEYFTLERNNENFEYKTVAEKFSLIDQNTKSVIIPYDQEAKVLIEKLRTAIFPKKYLKQLQPYIVSLYENDYDALKNKGLLDNINDFAEVLLDMSKYSEGEGLIINTESEALYS